jgi:upstream activation factor subunit UAF30
MASISSDKLRQEIQNILKNADLNTLSSKKVRQMLEAKFQCDLTARKKEIDDILMAEITTRDIQPIPTNVESNQMDDDIQCETTSDEDSQTKQMQIQSDNNNQQMPKSDQELAMEIHQQENRPTLRGSIVSLFKEISFLNKTILFKSSTSSTLYKKATTTPSPSLKIERRRTTYNKELDISDQLAVVVGGHRVNIQLILIIYSNFFFLSSDASIGSC